jgi:hypothetical protein
MEIIERKHRLAPLAQIGCIEHLLERPTWLTVPRPSCLLAMMLPQWTKEHQFEFEHLTGPD